MPIEWLQAEHSRYGHEQNRRCGSTEKVRIRIELAWELEILDCGETNPSEVDYDG